MHNPAEIGNEGYEATDMHVGIIWAALVALMLMLFGGVVATIVIVRGFDVSRGPEPLNTAGLSPLAVEENRNIDGPPLQMDVKKDRDALLQPAMEHLNTYGIVSDEHGLPRAHVPIERAFDMIVDNNVSYRQQPQVALESDGTPAAQEES